MEIGKNFQSKTLLLLNTYVAKPPPRVKRTWSPKQVFMWFTPGSPPQCTFCPSHKKLSLDFLAKAFQHVCYNAKSMKRFGFYSQINCQLFPHLFKKTKLDYYGETQTEQYI